MKCNLFKNIAVATAIGALVAPAGAAAETPAAAVHEVKQSRDAVLDFWSTKRMKNAEGRQMPTAAPGAQRAAEPTPEPQATPGSGEGIQAPKARKTKSPRGTAGAAFRGLELPWNNNSYGTASPIDAVGRIYLGKRGHCTGTVVSTNIVVTAAHCLQDGGSGSWMKNVIFAPGVDGSRRPYGRFAARVLVTPRMWASPAYNRAAGTDGAGYYGTDYAYIVLRPNRAGRHVASYTGAYAVLAGAPSGTVYHLGYPTEGNWNGCTDSFCRPYHCQSPIQRYTQYQGGKYDAGLSCFTTGGASGGPWFQQYRGEWYVTSVMSHMGQVHMQSDGRSRYGTTFFGSYFDNDVISLFNFAQRQ